MVEPPSMHAPYEHKHAIFPPNFEIKALAPTRFCDNNKSHEWTTNVQVNVSKYNFLLIICYYFWCEFQSKKLVLHFCILISHDVLLHGCEIGFHRINTKYTLHIVNGGGGMTDGRWVRTENRHRAASLRNVFAVVFNLCSSNFSSKLFECWTRAIYACITYESMLYIRSVPFVRNSWNFLTAN